MLVTLAISDVVLIERLHLEFCAGLHALTGETGAGKSIILDALGLATGLRADSGLVRSGASQASVAAGFLLPTEHPAWALLEEQGLDPGAGPESLILRRIISVDGRSRAFVNDQPVGVALLRRLGATLIEVHGQFDTHGLMDPRAHVLMLDAFAGLTQATADVGALFRRWRGAEDIRANAVEAAERAREEETYLRHALAELDQLDPQEQEENGLLQDRTRLLNHGKLVEALTRAAEELSGDRGAEGSVGQARRVLGRAASMLGPQVEPVLAALDRAADDLVEAGQLIAALMAGIEMDDRSLDQVEERLFELRRVARKHAVAVDALPELRAGLAGRLSLLETAEAGMQRLEADCASARAAYLAATASLSAGRVKAASRLDELVAAELAPLRLGGVRFVTDIGLASEAEWGITGTDKVQFLVATNPGTDPGQMSKVASGGELARLMLALKVVLVRTGQVPTIVFDEVDSGIGGAVADAVGLRLARLAQMVQVLVVTHSPQVAARAAWHWHVAKTLDGAGRMNTEIRALAHDERVEEIARMLSGAQVSTEARSAARRLLKTAVGADR